MLTEQNAKKIGLKACVDKIGYEFCKKHADTVVCSYGVTQGVMQCYLGIDDQPAPEYDTESMKSFILTDDEYLPYYANCDVNMEDGTVRFRKCNLPEQNL